MRNIILLLMMVCAMATTAQTSDKHKKAVLLVHYGTNNDQSRAKTIDVINQKMAEAMPQTVVCEAYSSKMVIASLKKRGIQKNTISEALRQLYAKGCTDIIIQSTHLLPGVMQEIIEKEADKVRFLFDTIQLVTISQIGIIGHELPHQPDGFCQFKRIDCLEGFIQSFVHGHSLEDYFSQRFARSISFCRGAEAWLN